MGKKLTPEQAHAQEQFDEAFPEKKSKRSSSQMETALALAFDFTGTPHGDSRWKEAKRCPYAHHLRYIQQVRPKEQADYFALGNLGHAVIGYLAMGSRDGFNAKVDHVIEEAKKRKLFPMDIISEGRRLLKAYVAKWGPQNGGFGETVDVLEVEYLMKGKIGGCKYTARADLLLETDHPTEDRSHLVIVDHKFWAKMPSDDDDVLVKKLSVNSQFMGLCWLLREQEEEMPSFCLNIITKTRIPDFKRLIWTYSDEELDRWAEAHAEFLGSGMVDQTWQNYSECVPWVGKPCWAFEWCHGAEGAREELYTKPIKIRRK